MTPEFLLLKLLLKPACRATKNHSKVQERALKADGGIWHLGKGIVEDDSHGPMKRGFVYCRDWWMFSKRIDDTQPGFAFVMTPLGGASEFPQKLKRVLLRSSPDPSEQTTEQA
ncbi:hypothetical protein BJ741DRAFT_584270 [Chytriomyces cf. hyalinus JEL632]|nr:hypothetical protein BJ741DRAFT_584270 [Chytriomyces cf. hyalinus JEL632]